MSRYTISEILTKISNDVVGVFSIAALQDGVVALCQDIFDAESCSLFLLDENREHLRMVAARGYAEQFLDRPAPFKPHEQVIENPKNKPEKLGITGWIASTGQSFMSNSVDSLRKHPHWLGIYDTAQFGPDKSVYNFYGVPLKAAHDEVLGVLKVEGKREFGTFREFTADDAHIFEILAAHIAHAIADVNHVEKIQRQREELETITNALHKVVGSLSGELPMQYLLDEIISTTAEILGAEACVLFLKDETRDDILIERAGRGYVEQLIGKAEYHLIPKREMIVQPARNEDKVGLTAWIAITGEPFLAPNNEELQRHPHWIGRYDKEHYSERQGKRCESFLGVPLLVRDEVVGVLKVENKKIDGRYVSFTEQDSQVFKTLARTIAIAIGTVREQRFQRERQITNAMYRVSEALAGSFEIGPLLEKIVKTGKEIFDAEACVVFLVDQADPTWLIETKGEGYVKHLEGKAKYRLIPKDELIERPFRSEDKVGLTAWIAITGRPFLARNNAGLQSHPHWKGQYDVDHYPEGSGKRCESFLGLPLRISGETLGVLKVENKKVSNEYRPFDEQDQHIFQFLVNSAAIAIRNARDLLKSQENRELAAIGMSAATMAHRMGNPLQRILNKADSLDNKLRHPGDVQEQDPDVEAIIKTVDQMNSAILRMENAARQLKPRLKMDLHDFGEILSSNFIKDQSFIRQFQRNHIQASIVGIEQVAPYWVRCNTDLIEEAFCNLVDNAIEAIAETGNGGCIDIIVTEEHGKLHVDIQDDGPGIDENILPRSNLFDPFETTKKGGLGLGLFIARRNIEAHGGSLSYEKNERGACFRIELPLERSQEK